MFEEFVASSPQYHQSPPRHPEGNPPDLSGTCAGSNLDARTIRVFPSVMNAAVAPATQDQRPILDAHLECSEVTKVRRSSHQFRATNTNQCDGLRLQPLFRRETPTQKSVGQSPSLALSQTHCGIQRVRATLTSPRRVPPNERDSSHHCPGGREHRGLAVEASQKHVDIRTCHPMKKNTQALVTPQVG